MRRLCHRAVFPCYYDAEVKPYRAAHGWTIEDHAGLPPDRIREFFFEPIEEVPASIAGRIGPCRISISERLEPDAASRWRTGEGSETLIELACAGVEPHDLALELLVCLGQLVWESASAEEQTGYLRLLEAELAEGVTGEIDEDVLPLKASLLRNPSSRGHLKRYTAASFASTLAEYIHCLWHDVTVRAGPEHLDSEVLRERLEFFERRFPPDPGQQWVG